MKIGILKTLKSLAVVMALAFLSLPKAAGAIPEPCPITFPPGTQLTADITVYPNYLPGELDYYRGTTSPSAWFAVAVSAPGQALPVGIYGAFCVDQSHYLPADFFEIPAPATRYTGTLLSICDEAALANVPNHGGTPPLGPPPVVSMATWHKVNYILNHKASYYWWNVQIALNRLVGGPTPNDPALPFPEEGYPTADASEIDAIIADAEANAAGWTVPCGGVQGVLFTLPDGGTDPDGFLLYQVIVIEVPVVCLTCPTQCGTVGTYYSSSLQGGARTEPYFYSLVDGSLPLGLILNPLTGEISGLPLEAGTFSFSINFMDSTLPEPLTKTISCSITIYPAASVNSESICAGGSATLTATAAEGSTFLWSNGATTQSITVSPTSTTTYEVTVTSPGGCITTASGTVTVATSTPVLVCASDKVLSLISGGSSALYCSYTPGGWGAAPNGNNPGALLANNFAAVFPSGLEVGIPGTGGYSMKFTSAAAIQAYLPSGSTPGALNADLVNPTTSSAGVLGSHVLALKLNVAFSAAGITANISGPLGNLLYTDVSSLLSGKTINQILAIAQTALGGGALPAGVTYSQLNGLLTMFNEGFDNCSTTPWAALHLLPLTQQVDTTPSATGFATATDSCDAAPVVTYTDVVTTTSCGGYEIKRTWKATNHSGAFSVCTQTITVIGQSAPTVSVNSGAICAGGSITLTASGATGTALYRWSNGATTQSITVSPTTTTSYSVTVTSAGGCTATAAGTVTVNPAPTVTVNSATLCAGETATLTATASAGVTYLWSNGATTQSITVSPSTTTSYSVTVTSTGGCTATASATVTVNPFGKTAGSFNLAGSGASTGAANVRTYTDANGVSVKVTGFSRNSAGVWSAAYVAAYSGGLGVTDVNEDGSAPGHTVDNSGNNNYLLFEFSQPVIVSSALLGYVSGDSDVSIRIGTFANPFTSHITLSDTTLAAFGYAEENAGGSTTRTATFNANQLLGNAVVIAASLTDKTTVDQFKVQTLHTFKPVCFSPVSVGNFVWNDANQNGIQDSGEVGINGVQLKLTGTSATGVAVTLTTTTASNGSYLFAGLEPGTYTVTVEASNFTTGGALVGLTASPTLVGSNRAVDSNVNPSATSPASLPSGTSDLTLDFGYFLPTPPPTTCVPTTFDFSGSSSTDGTDGNTRTYTVNGVTVKASAFSRDRASGAWTRSFLGSYGGGLGVTDSSEGTGDGNLHTVDNVGGRDNYILFEFSQAVVVNRAFLGYVVNDSDLSAWIGSVGSAYTTTQMLNDAYLTGLTTELNSTASTTTRWADLNANSISGNVLIVAADVTDTTPEDYFKVEKVDICAAATVPPPVDCVASTVTFSGSSATSGTAGNIRTFSAGGVSVKASAFSRTTGGTWNTAYLGAYGGGLGVTDGSEGTGASADEHTVDNIGRANYVLFEFSQPVTVTRAYLGYVVGDSDLTVWVGNASNPYTSHLTLSDALLNGAIKENNDTIATGARWADFNQAEVRANYLIIAASVADDSPEDRFKIQKLVYCATAAPSAPSPWTSKDIGCTVNGYTSANAGLFTVKGSGADIWGTSDGFRYVYQPASGDCSIIVRVASVQNTDLWAKAGIMVRETLNADAKHAAMFITPGNGVALQSRATTGGTSLNSNVTGKTAPYYLKLVRSGSTFTGYYSATGSTWTSIGSQTISMTSSVYIGLAVTSHDANVLSTATFDSVTATP